MQECVWWTVYAYAKCVQPMWHLTCTQQQLAEIHVKIQFWSNLLGLLIGFHWVPSIHASTNVIPTGFVSRCRWSLSIWSISDACACRVQASVRLFKMLRHIISKVKIFSDWCSVGTVLDCPPLEVLLLNLPLWVFGFFLESLECCSSQRFGITTSYSSSRPQMLQRRFWAFKVRRRRQSGPWAWHGQGLFND